MPNSDKTKEYRNYMTPQGAMKLQKEHQTLKYKERPEVVKVVEWAAGNGDRSENGDYIYGKRRLREIDRRLAYLSKQIESLEVVDPTTIKSTQILFGATVTICDEEDIKRTYSIVGVDESDANEGRISWVSPLAKAIYLAKVGDIVSFESPRGQKEVEILEIRYQEIK